MRFKSASPANSRTPAAVTHLKPHVLYKPLSAIPRPSRGARKYPGRQFVEIRDRKVGLTPMGPRRRTAVQPGCAKARVARAGDIEQRIIADMQHVLRGNAESIASRVEDRRMRLRMADVARADAGA